MPIFSQPSDRQDFLQEAHLQQRTLNGQTGGPKEVESQYGNNIEAWLNTRPEKPLRERGRSVSTHASVQIRRRTPSLAIRHPAPVINTSNTTSNEAESEITAVTSAHEQETSESANFFDVHPYNKPSGSMMKTKADVILQHHLTLLAKRQLRVWRGKALQLQEDQANLDLIALHHDKNALLIQALETWHNRILEKRSIADTERFFVHLEQRAVGARDLYLLHKAFTHWNVEAYEEAQRTSAARRHILRTRTFNAWRDITAVNELKVRRQVLKKFFGVWKRQHVVISGNHTTALQRYEGELVRKIFKRWVRRVWDIKATIWWAEGSNNGRSLPGLFLPGMRWMPIVLPRRRGVFSLPGIRGEYWRAKTDDRVRQDQQATTFHQAYVRSSLSENGVVRH